MRNWRCGVFEKPAILLLCVGILFYCGEAVSVDIIEESTAKQLLIERYQQLFAGKYYLNVVDNKHYPFPEIESGDFDRVMRDKIAWNLEIVPPAGLTVIGRVDLRGEWAELTTVHFAPD